MTCYRPLQAFRLRKIFKSINKFLPSDYKFKVFFGPNPNFIKHESLTVPCGKCIGCRLDYSRQWAIRCLHEASLYTDNCFITLTYSEEHLPFDRSLRKSHFQKFMKRLRKEFGEGIRFFHCGEYGEKFGRPHYHALLFNFDFKDKKLWRIQRGQRLYTSDTLSRLWKFGHCSVGSVTFSSAAYVSRYILKKVYGDDSKSHYETVDNVTGEVFTRAPEYTTMSRRPGIGKAWFEKFKTDVYPGDFVLANGTKMKPPRFYDSQFELTNPDDFEVIKEKRKAKSLLTYLDNTPERLKVRETVQLSKMNRLVRNFSKED